MNEASQLAEQLLKRMDVAEKVAPSNLRDFAVRVEVELFLTELLEAHKKELDSANDAYYAVMGW